VPREIALHLFYCPYYFLFSSLFPETRQGPSAPGDAAFPSDM